STPYSELALRLAFGPVPVDETAMMVGGNAARLYGFDLDALAPLAAQYGPKVADVHHLVDRAEIPLEAYKCPAFAPQNAA
ncbi:MAG: amidohydrolase, partial [Ilumatobacteraceae bacterium]